MYTCTWAVDLLFSITIKFSEKLRTNKAGGTHSPLDFLRYLDDWSVV